jgi:predicted SAM-dependent methyltransferase
MVPQSIFRHDEAAEQSRVVEASMLQALKTLSRSRPITSYGKIQTALSYLLRNRAFQLHRLRSRGVSYLNLGCGGGPNLPPGFINVDYNWTPAVDVCWNIETRLPFEAGSISGIFIEHCLEHFPIETVKNILIDCRRMMRPGAIIRIIVPDAGLYLETYVARIRGDDTRRFPYEGPASSWRPIAHVNRVFYEWRESQRGHRIMFDEDLLCDTLKDCGFRHVARKSFRDGDDPVLLIDSPGRVPESLYV